jgi:hypothetical protein
MGNEGKNIVTIDEGKVARLVAAAATAEEMIALDQRINQVLNTVMKEGMHYGPPYPGSQQRAIRKPGIEKLFRTFRIRVEHDIEDRSTEDATSFKVTSRAYHIPTDDFLGDYSGFASSEEEKYKWRAATGDGEFEATDPSRRRLKFKKKRNGDEYTIKQVRTGALDLANTVLKMAEKRADAGVCLNVLAASDIFVQDFEDMPEFLIEEMAEREPLAEPKRTSTPPAEPPQVMPDPTPEPPPPDLDDLPWPEQNEIPLPQSRDAQVLSDNQVIVEFLDAGVQKEGTSSKGNAWTLYSGKANDGKKYSTFSKEHGDMMLDSADGGGPCLVTFKEDKYGRTITDITWAP